MSATDPPIASTTHMDTSRRSSPSRRRISR